MPKDYKDAPSPRAESRLNHPLLLGMIIGLLLGVVISLSNTLLELFSPRGTDDFTMATANALLCLGFGILVY